MALTPVQTGALSLLVVYLLYNALSSVLLSFRRRRLMKQAGCAEPVIVGGWPLGLDLMQRAKDAYGGGTFPDFFDECFKEHGNTWQSRGDVKFHTIDDNVLQMILSTHFNDFVAGAELIKAVRPLLGSTGIFTVDGHRWENARALLRPQFSRDQDFDMLEKHVQNLLQRIFADMRERTVTLDIQPLFVDLALDSATESLMGESAGMLCKGVVGEDNEGKSGNKKEMGLQEAFTFGQQVCAVRHGMGLVGSYMVFGRDAYTKFQEACRVCHTWADSYVDRALRARSERARSEPGFEESRKNYVALDEMVKLTQDREVLRDQCLTLLLAGRDTTSSFLAWTIYSLARQPRVFARLREEVLGIFGTEALPTHAKLKTATYLSWVLKEVLRLYPSAPFDGRGAAKDIVLPAGGGPDGSRPLFLRKGQSVRYSIFSLHRRKDLYGEDADEFRPERWEDPKLAKGAIAWGYIPFNGGPRKCLGQQHAMNKVSYIITRLTQTCTAISLPRGIDPNTPPKYQLAIAMFSMDGVHVQLTRAETEN